MLKKLLIVINKTDQEYSFTNTECGKDSTTIQAYSSSTLPCVNLTPGQHDEGCDIPDCSGEEYYAEHHMTFSSDNNTLTFWFDDHKNQYYYSQTGSYNNAQVIPGNATPSGTSKKVIFIMEDNTLLISDIV